MTTGEKIDTVIESARITGIEIQELFLNERDFNEINHGAINNVPKGFEKEQTILTYQSEIGIIRLSKI